MIYNVIFSLLICISSSIISMDTDPIDSKNDKSYLAVIRCLPEKKVALFSSKNFDIFEEKKPIHHMNLGKNYSFDMGQNKKGKLLALSSSYDYPITYNAETGEQKTILFPLKDYAPNRSTNANAIDAHTWTNIIEQRINLLKKNNIPIDNPSADIMPTLTLDFCPTNNTFFFYDLGLFVSYSVSDQKITTCNVPIGSGGFFPIACNPTNTELIRFFDSETLEILESNQNFQKKMSLKTDFECDTAAYAPDGHTLAILGRKNDKSKPCYFVCDLNDKRSPKPAYQMISPHDSTDLEYIAGIFHSHLPLFVALSQCGDLRFFNYLTKKCISKEKIFSNKIGQPPFSQRCLDFDEEGNVLIGYDNRWITAQVPQINSDEDTISYEENILNEEDISNSNICAQEPHAIRIKAIYTKPTTPSNTDSIASRICVCS